MDLLTPFNPATPEAERTAWTAGRNLSNPPDDFDTPLADGMTPRAVAAETYRAYYEHRQAKGLPVFPTLAAESAREQQGEFRKAYGGLDKLKDNLRPEQWEQVALASQGETDPEEFQARVINGNFLSSLMGREIPPESLSTVRDAYAAQVLGLQGEVTDKAVYQAIQTRHAEDETDAATFSGKLTEGITKRLATVGKVETGAPTPDNSQIKGFDRPGPKSLEYKATVEERDALLQGVSERNRPAFRDKWNEANRELSRMFRQHGPLVEQITRGVNLTRDAENPESALLADVTRWAEMLPDAPKDRDVVLAMLGNALANLPEDQRGVLTRMAAAAARGAYQGGEGTAVALQQQARQGIRALPYGDPNTFEMTSDAKTAQMQRRGLLLDTIRGNGMKLSRVTDNLFSQMGIAAAPSVWMFPAAFTPVGQVAIAESLAGQSMSKAAIANPDVAEGLRTNAGTASGMAQAAIEVFTNQAGVKLMLGKLPRFAGLLNRAGIASPVGRAALGFGAGYAATTGMEYAEEAAQGATDLAFQALAADLGGQKPEVDWGKYFSEWATVAGPEQKETLLAVSAFGMIAGAGASYNHFTYGGALARSKTFLRAHGFTEAEVRDISATTDLDEAAEKTRAAFDLAQARAAVATPEQQARLGELRAEAIAVLKASNEAYAAAGMPRVVKERNDFTDSDQFVFIDTATGGRQAFETEEEALGAWQDWNAGQSAEAIESIQEAGEAGFIAALTGEGAMTEDVNVERVNKTVTPATERAAAEADVKAAETDTRKAISPAQERAAREKLESARGRLRNIAARVEVFLLERGIDPANPTAVGRALESVTIKAKSFATMLQGRVVGYTVQLFNGVEIQDIAEDFAETAMKIAVDTGFADPEIILDDIRRYEAASGNRVIAPDYEYDPANTLPLIEGFSKLARGVLMGNVRSGLLPPEVSAWIELQASLTAGSVEVAKAAGKGLEFAMDVQTAGELRRAITGGQVPARLERLLKDSLGLDPAAQQRRLEQKMEEQLAAEAMEGFPEISEVAKGRLPHPETLRENNHPLYGEVRRIWESLKKPTKRRTKDGRTVDRVNEANAFFLPVGDMDDLDNVRQAINERGFAFDSITDMLDALDVSISYGKPFYGTGSVADESWAMGDRSTVTPTAETRTFQGTNGETLIGPATFAISAFHGTPHKVDKFSTDKIGTGEGAQAFGWGLYFAAAMEVAREYQKGLSGFIAIDGNVIHRNNRTVGTTGDSGLDDLIVANMGDIDAAIRDAQDGLEEYIPKLEALRNRIEAKTIGNLYTVTLKAEDEDLLDWDKPLSEQSERVRESVKSFGDIAAPDGRTLDDMTGKYIARMILGNSADTAGVDGAAKFASQKLQSAGIRGIRFLDGNSRSAGEGSYNYVIFDAADIEIVEENGTPVDLLTAGESYAMSKADRPLFSATNVAALRHDKTDWLEEDASPAGADDIVSKYYKTAAFAGIPHDALLIPMPSTSGRNILPDALANRISKDFGQSIEKRVVGVATAKGEAKNKRTFFDKEADPVGFVPNEEVLPELQGKVVFITEDVHNTGESWIAFARMLMEFGVEVRGVATLVSTEQRMTSPRDIERLSKKVAANTGKGIDEVLPVMHSLFDGTFKQLFNKAEADISRTGGERRNADNSRKLFEIAASGRRTGAYSNPLGSGKGSQGEVLGGDGLSQGTFGDSWAMSTRGILRLEDAIAKRMTRGPDERADYFQRLRDRLAATVLMLRETKRNLAIDQSDTERERNRIRDAMAEAGAILKALPMEARGRVPFSMNDILDADTETGQVNALIRLIDKADEALEVVLLKEYREAFETLLDLAKPDLRQNKQVRGRLTPETQRMVGRILAAVTLTPAELAIAIPAKQAEIDALEATTPTSPEEIKAAQKALVELYEEQVVLETFGAFATLDAAATAHAYEQLQSIYITGRTTRKILDEARKAEIDQAKKELLATLPEADQAKHAERTADKGFLDAAEAFRLGMSSFHQVMEWLFPRSTVARDFQEQVRKADRSFTRAKLAAKDRFDRFTYGVWNLSGVSRARKRNRILADLSTLRTDWGITLQEGITFASEKLTEEQAAAILDGTLKPGWETDSIAMTSLRQAVADFRMQRLKAQNEDKRFTSTVIRFQRLTNRGKPGAFVASDLQALYFLQLFAQEQYRPALDKFGFTAEVIASIEKKINPKAIDLGDFLRDEYDAEWNRLNPVYRAIYGLDMPKIRNYAPGMFEHLDAKSGGDSTIDPYGNASTVNAMSAGFTKARTHHMARPKLTNAMAGFWGHLEATEYFIAYAEIMRDARQIFRNPEVRRRIEGSYGTRVASLWSQWLDALEVDGNFRAVEMMALAEMSHRTLATQSAVGLAFNVGVLFKQASAAFGVLLEMPTGQAVKGFARALANPASLKPVWNSEAVQQRVLAGISPEDRKLIDAGKASPSIIMELLELGRLPIAYADAAFTTLGASIAYNYHLGEALKAGIAPAAAEASALAAASRVIERTAQPSTSQDKSMAELTAKGFGKFLFLFKSDPRQKLAIVANAVQEYRAGRPGAKGKLARKAIWGWLIYGLMAEVMTDIWQSISRDDDDEERWAWQDYAAAAISGPVSGLPLYGQAFDYLVRTAFGGKAFQNAANPIEAGAGRLVPSTMKLIDQLVSDDKDVTVTDILTASQQWAAAGALAVGGIDPRFAIVPASLRLARDAWGTLTNLAAMLTEPTADDAALNIVRELSANQKTTRDGTAATNDQLAKDLGNLPPAERSARLAKLDRDTRTAVTQRIRKAQMTSSELALRGLSKENRKLAVERITAGMNEAEREAYRERLRSLGLD